MASRRRPLKFPDSPVPEAAKNFLADCGITVRDDQCAVCKESLPCSCAGFDFLFGTWLRQVRASGQSYRISLRPVGDLYEVLVERDDPRAVVAQMITDTGEQYCHLYDKKTGTLIGMELIDLALDAGWDPEDESPDSAGWHPDNMFFGFWRKSEFRI